ncbi:MAG: hypothetical protein V1933_03130, partial [Candidatus Omnitrophota bacterium]
MKLKFDANQQFQIDAINAVLDIFEGQSKNGYFHIASNHDLLGIYPNQLALDEETIQQNIRKVQKRNGIKNGIVPPLAVNDEAISGMDFSIEMETGTGKTYVYLRTILELNRNPTSTTIFHNLLQCKELTFWHLIFHHYIFESNLTFHRPNGSCLIFNA